MRWTSAAGNPALRAGLRFVVATAALVFSVPGATQVETERPPVVAGAKSVVIERIKVHSPAIEGNLEGNSPDRDVIVVLPPSYRANPGRRYPVLYALHGYSIGAEQWINEIRIPQVAEGAFASGVPEMIVVLPTARRCTMDPCIRHRSRRVISRPSLPAISSPMSTAIIARCPGARAAVSWDIRWAAMARRGSASSMPIRSARSI